MYVYYWVSATGSGNAFTLVAENAMFTDDLPKSPSDSVWIVPGTVGVDD